MEGLLSFWDEVVLSENAQRYIPLVFVKENIRITIFVKKLKQSENSILKTRYLSVYRDHDCPLPFSVGLSMTASAKRTRFLGGSPSVGLVPEVLSFLKYRDNNESRFSRGPFFRS